MGSRLNQPLKARDGQPKDPGRPGSRAATARLATGIVVTALWGNSCSPQAPATSPRLPVSANADRREPEARHNDGSYATDTQSPTPRHWTSALEKACPGLDARLIQAATGIARQPFNTLTARLVRAEMRRAGSPHVWPKVWSVEGPALNDTAAAERFEEWFAGQHFEGQPRCGTALKQLPDGTQQAVAVLVDAVADLSPLPTEVSAGTWVEVRAQLLTDADETEVLLLPPTGRPRHLLSHQRGQLVHAKFRADRRGAWLIQVKPRLASGARPALEAVVFADQSPEVEPHREVPGEHAGAQEIPPKSLYAMLNQARLSEGLPELSWDDSLAAAAQAHAQRMHAAQKLAHDLGGGGPRQRLEQRGESWRRVDENIVRAGNARGAHRTLWASPSHRDNLLSPHFSRVGIGVIQDASHRLWVSQIFAD